MASASHQTHATDSGTYVPGSMDITEQERTFHGFVKMVSWGAGIVILVLIFLALVNI